MAPVLCGMSLQILQDISLFPYPERLQAHFSRWHIPRSSLMKRYGSQALFVHHLYLRGAPLAVACGFCPDISESCSLLL